MPEQALVVLQTPSVSHRAASKAVKPHATTSSAFHHRFRPHRQSHPVLLALLVPSGLLLRPLKLPRAPPPGASTSTVTRVPHRHRPWTATAASRSDTCGPRQDLNRSTPESQCQRKNAPGYARVNNDYIKDAGEEVGRSEDSSWTCEVSRRSHDDEPSRCFPVSVFPLGFVFVTVFVGVCILFVKP